MQLGYNRFQIQPYRERGEQVSPWGLWIIILRSAVIFYKKFVNKPLV